MTRQRSISNPSLRAPVRGMQVLEKLLKDSSTMVLGSAVASFNEVSTEVRLEATPTRATGRQASFTTGPPP